MASKWLTAEASGGSPEAVPFSDAIIDVWSREILFEAEPLLRFDQVATRKEELGVLPGKTIKFLRYAALEGGDEIDEDEEIETDVLETSVIELSVKQHVKAISFSEFALRSTFVDLMGDAATALGRNLARYRNIQLMNTLLGAPNTLYAGGKEARDELTLTDYFGTALLKDGAELLSTNKSPKFGGQSWVCFVHPHQDRRMRDDRDWKYAQQYTTPSNLLFGELGSYEDVKFVSTTLLPIIDTSGNIWIDGKDTGVNAESWSATTPTYRSLLVGDHALGLAVSLEAHLRDDGIKNYGTKHNLAWFGIWGSGLIESGHVVILESA